VVSDNRSHRASTQSLHDLNADRAALAAGAWQGARDAFERTLAIAGTLEVLEGLGLAAWWLDLADVVFDSRERACRSRGDQIPARLARDQTKPVAHTIRLKYPGNDTIPECKYVNGADDPRNATGAKGGK
jgi:hypothetical protein